MKIIFIILFFLLQTIKPLIIIFFYKWATNFHPTIMNDYEMYLLLIKNTFSGGMLAPYTISVIISELIFLITPFYIFKKYSKI